VCTVTKRADLHPKTNSKTGAKTSTLATVQPLALFGSAPLLLQGEDAGAYDELLGRVSAAVKPVDIIEEMLTADAVSLEWEVLRWRRLQTSLMRALALKSLEEFLSENLDYDQYRKFFAEDLTEILQETLEDQIKDAVQTLAHQCAENERDAVDKVNQIFANTYLNMDNIREGACARKAKELTQDYAQRKPSSIDLTHKLLASVGSSIDTLMAKALAKDLDSIERIDHLTTIAETRRNAMLREIDRRRAVLGEALRRQVQEVEGEFDVVEKTPAATKSAA
jgi:hypothetical protein